jgi:hypothetical protein
VPDVAGLQPDEDLALARSVELDVLDRERLGELF